MDALTCVHCLGETTPGEAVFDQDDRGTLIFCCPACRAIYHLIRDEGFDNFYREREGWIPGRPEISRPEIAAFPVRIESGEAETDLVLSGLRCASCVWLIERFLAKTPGLISARVNYATHRTRVRWDPGATDLKVILDRIAALGYRSLPLISGIRQQAAARERKSLLIRLATASFFTFQIMLFSIVLYEGYFRGMDQWTERAISLVLWGLATPVIFYAGYPFIRNTLQGLRVGAVNMDTLVFLGSMSAYLYSVFALTRNSEVYFDTAAMIVTLILLGRFLEAGARQKASAAISALMGLQPAEARAVSRPASGQTKTSLVPVSSLEPGDLVEVIPGDTMPFDCEVIEGESEVDESMLTGEPMPVFKSKGAEVFSGTSNLNGWLLLTIKRVGKETVLAKIINAVEEAQAGKAPVERLTDRITVWFVPVILTLAIITFFYWQSTGVGTTTSLMNAISVLIIACPCALGLATPMAVLAGTSLASREGLLLRGGDVLEIISGIDTVAFDKTGTLTTGMPELDRIIYYDTEQEEVNKCAASLEQHSEHTIAKAIRSSTGAEDIYPVLHYRTYPGKGVAGRIKGQQAVLGNYRFLREMGIIIDNGQEASLRKLSASGGTVVGFGLDRKLQAWFAVNDSLRLEAPEIVSILRGRGYRIMLLTGDERQAALEMARESGIDEEDVHAGLTPVEKAGVIRNMRSNRQRVLMVGDGINDAPALTEADAGAAMGRATDIAIRSAGAVLMREDLGLVPRLLEISGRTFATIKQNLFWAFSYNIVAVPLAATGKIHPIISAGLMATSSLLVVGNSLRLQSGARKAVLHGSRG